VNQFASASDTTACTLVSSAMHRCCRRSHCALLTRHAASFCPVVWVLFSGLGWGSSAAFLLLTKLLKSAAALFLAITDSRSIGTDS
jgi:hypothetical protein